MPTHCEVVEAHISRTSLRNVFNTRTRPVEPKTIQPAHVWRAPIADDWGDALLEHLPKLFQTVSALVHVLVDAGCQVAALARLP